MKNNENAHERRHRKKDGGKKRQHRQEKNYGDRRGITSYRQTGNLEYGLALCSRDWSGYEYANEARSNAKLSDTHSNRPREQHQCHPSVEFCAWMFERHVPSPELSSL